MKTNQYNNPSKYQILDQRYYDEHTKNNVEFENSLGGPLYK